MATDLTTRTEEEPNTCCGLPMIYQDIWNVRRYQCQHRSHHPVIYVNLATGGTLVDEDGYGPRVIPWHRPVEEGLPVTTDLTTLELAARPSPG